MQLGSDGATRANYMLRSPIGGIYILASLFSLSDGRTLAAGTYGMDPLYSATREMVHEVLELGSNGATRSLVSIPLWNTPGGAALRRDGALLEAGTFTKSSTFGLGAGELQASGSDLYLLQRAL